MQRKMLIPKLQDKTRRSEIRKRTKIIDIIEYTLNQKWRWAGHMARIGGLNAAQSGNQGDERRSRRRPSRRWQDDTARKEGATWNRKATGKRQWKALMEGCILQWMNKA